MDLINIDFDEMIVFDGVIMKSLSKGGFLVMKYNIILPSVFSRS